MDTGLDGKVAIITGAARGLGQEFAVRLAAEGACVVATDVRDCDETVGQVTNAGGRALGLRQDVTDMDSCQAAADKAIAEFGRIDILVNNAALYGGLKGGRFDSLDPDEWNRTMDVNVTGIWQCCKTVVPAMREVGGGGIINITSLAAVYGLAYALHYTVSKAAVIGITRGLARELGRDWIRVNSIDPS
ncbi:MAG TPA: SDR family NAD(P)-dependent oxidoreductase, partial [Sneathiellales bacterium]|nr:SDR family NAD(P)-dependent oxidoreductase [Sneathiellales bacterium]